MTHSHDTATPALSVESAAGVSIEALQAAHVARQEEWCPDQKPDLSFRGNEMAGEVGEACNVIKKLERERQGWRGSRATVDDLGDELADVIHTAILCSITAGIELGPRVVAKFNATSEKNGLATTLAAAPTRNPSPAAKGILDQHQAIHDEWLEEALNKATPSPQPAEAVREALLNARKALLSEHWHEKSQLISQIDAALASDPAPAGEVVEPVGFINESFRDGLVEQKGKGYWHHQMVCGKRFDGSFPIYLARPAPEDTARLREEAERFLVDLSAALGGFSRYTNEQGDRRPFEDWSAFLLKKAEELRLENDASRRKCETFKRERDDARKALETANGLISDARGAWWYARNEAKGGHLSRIWDRLVASDDAARSASREGASDE